MRKLGDILAGPETWCRHYLGRDANGDSVEGDDPKAVQRCLLGALQALSNKDEDAMTASYNLMHEITLRRFKVGIVDANNFRAEWPQIAEMVQEFDERRAAKC